MFLSYELRQQLFKLSLDNPQDTDMLTKNLIENKMCNKQFSLNTDEFQYFKYTTRSCKIMNKKFSDYFPHRL